MDSAASLVRFPPGTTPPCPSWRLSTEDYVRSANENSQQGKQFEDELFVYGNFCKPNSAHNILYTQKKKRALKWQQYIIENCIRHNLFLGKNDTKMSPLITACSFPTRECWKLFLETEIACTGMYVGKILGYIIWDIIGWRLLYMVDIHEQVGRDHFLDCCISIPVYISVQL